MEKRKTESSIFFKLKLGEILNLKIYYYALIKTLLNLTGKILNSNLLRIIKTGLLQEPL